MVDRAKRDRQGGIACGIAMVAIYIGVGIGPPVLWRSVTLGGARIHPDEVSPYVKGSSIHNLGVLSRR